MSTSGGSSGGFTNPMTTAGDLIIGGASGAAARLGIGSAGQVLTVAAGDPSWAAAAGGASWNGTSGSWYGGPYNGGLATTLAYAQGAIAAYPFWLPSAVTIDQLATYLNSGAVVGQAFVYADNGHSYPGSLVDYIVVTNPVSSGPQSAAVLNGTDVIGPGVVWLGFYFPAAGGATAGYWTTTSDYSNAYVGQTSPLSTSLGVQCFYKTGLANLTPPATFPAGAVVQTFSPLVQFRIH